MKELEDTNSTLKADLQRARSSLSNEPKMKEKVAELEGCVDTLKQQNSQLQVCKLETTCVCKVSRKGGSIELIGLICWTLSG